MAREKNKIDIELLTEFERKRKLFLGTRTGIQKEILKRTGYKQQSTVSRVLRGCYYNEFIIKTAVAIFDEKIKKSEGV